MQIELLIAHNLDSKNLPAGTELAVENGLGRTLIARKVAKEAKPIIATPAKPAPAKPSVQTPSVNP